MVKRTDPARCRFCEVGQHKRNMIYRIFSGLSKKDLMNIRDELKARKIIQ